jgi:chemotaxis protein CheD
VVVDMAGMQVTDDAEATLITYALGSCIAVMVYDPVRIVGGMIHYMLPQSSVNPDKARERPAMFADTGVPRLFEAMYAFGCNKQDLVVKVAGGGQLNDESGVFAIGKRNYIILRKLFWKNEVVISAEDVGGSKSRTTRLFVGTGRTTVSSCGEEVEL